MLGSKAAEAGFRIAHFPSIGSTMDEAMARSHGRDADRLWIVADEQTKGRGRHGRSWISEPGNLYASLLLMAPGPLAQAPQLGFVAGLALYDAVGPLLPAHHRLQLKWPNDALIDGAKAAGILLEGAHNKNGGHAVVIGFGLNIAHEPDHVAYPVTSLHRCGVTVTRDVLFSSLTDAFAVRLSQWKAGANFAGIRTDWMAVAAGIGTAIEVRQDTAMQKGIFREIDADGRMALDCDGKRVLVHAGDVYLNRT